MNLTFHVGICGLLSQQGHPKAFLSDQLSEVKHKYFTYELGALCHVLGSSTLATLPH